MTVLTRMKKNVELTKVVIVVSSLLNPLEYKILFEAVRG